MTSEPINKQIILAERPIGLPSASTWSLQEKSIAEIGDHQMLVEIHYVSLDPAMRGWVNDVKSYLPPVKLGGVMRAGTVGTVVDSNSGKFKVGDVVLGTGGVQKYVITDGRGWVKVDASQLPAYKYLSVLGMTGYTAYFGLLDVGQPQPNETLLVSGAAGAVGSVAGQIGKIKGCQVVGIAGSAEKCDYLVDELGFDAAINYKEESVYHKIKEHCPQGVDVYFDNVGGEILDAALARLNRRGRVVLCGGISQYNAEKGVQGPKNYLTLLTQRGRMEGFIILDYVTEFPRAAQDMSAWMAMGKLKSREQIEHGIENFHSAFLKLFSGDKKGKLILQI